MSDSLLQNSQHAYMKILVQLIFFIFSEADPKCPIIPSSIYGDVGDMNDAAEEVDAPQDKKSMPPGPGSGECGCISGPAYPNIDQCDFW